MRKRSVYLETFGCQMNVADSERAASVLQAAGYDLADSSDAAEVVIINTCSVREKAEQKALRRIRDINSVRPNDAPIIGVMGCVAQLEGETLFESAPSVRVVIGTGATERIPQLLRRAEEDGGRVIDLGERQTATVGDIAPSERHSSHVAFVPIIEGCKSPCERNYRRDEKVAHAGF